MAWASICRPPTMRSGLISDHWPGGESQEPSPENRSASTPGSCMGALPAIALGNFWLGLVLIGLNGIIDGLDGAVARQAGPTDRGAFLDIALDFFFYAAIPFAFVLADPTTNGVAGSLLLFSFIGTSSSFLAFAVIAKQRGMTALNMPKKGIYYLGGITEGAETIMLFVLICLVPSSFPITATLFAVLALLTTAIRWWWGWTSFGAN